MHIEWKRRLTIIGIVAGVYVGYRYILPVAVPFLIAWILAAGIYPLAYKIEKKIKIKRTFAGTLILVLLLGTLGILAYLGTAELFGQVKTVISQIPAFQRWFDNLVDSCCVFIEDTIGINAVQSREYLFENIDTIKNGMLSSITPQSVTRIFSSLKGMAVLLSGIVITFISTLLILGDMENIRKKIWDYSWLVGTRRVVRRLKTTTITYLKAQVIIIVLVAALCSAGFWFMKSPYFLLLGIGLGVLDAIPLIGTGTVLYPAAVILIIRGNISAAVICLGLEIATSLLRELLEPRLLGDKLGVSPIVILLSVYTGMLLFGVWGVLLGPLSFSTVFEIGKEWDIWD